MLLDIVILPPAKLRQRIGRAVLQATHGVACKFVIDNKKLTPHVSLFHIRTSKSRLPELSKAVAGALSHHKAFILSAQGVEVHAGDTVGVKLSNPQSFRQLHRAVVLKCYHLRTGVMPWTPVRPPTKLERYFHKRYGTQHVFRLKTPHVTLVVRIENKADVQQVAKRLKKIMRFSFTTNEIAICEVNWNHQVTRILKRFRV